MLLLNPGGNYLLYSKVISAQEDQGQLAPTPTPEESPAPTGSPTLDPSPTPEPIATHSPFIEPSSTPSPIFTPTLASEPTPFVSPPEPNESQGTNLESSSSPELSPALSASDVQEPDSLNQSLQNLLTSIFSLTTDKQDYGPTESVVISGSGLQPITIYSLTVSSTDDPAVNFTTPVVTDISGSFSYTYQLDGNYRPNYGVELKNKDGSTVVATTFTDALPDTTAPADPQDVHSTSHTVNIFSNDNTIDIAWTVAGSIPGAIDAQSGVDGYSYSFTTGNQDLPDTTKDVEELSTGTVSTGLADGSWYFHLRTVDNAGNWTSTVHAGPFLIDKTSPTGSFTINNGNAYTASTNVNLNFNGVSSDVVTLEIRNATVGSFQNPVVYTNPYSYVLPGGGGTKIISVRFTDSAGNKNSGVISDTIILDTTSPDIPVANPSAGDYTTDQSVELSSSDTLSGLSGIYYTTDTTTPSNTNGTLYSSPISIGVDTTLKAVAYDNAGNTSGVLEAVYGIAPVIFSETSSSVTSTSTTITWTTDDPATSRVIYDTVSHLVLGPAPNYGYANSTVEDPAKVTSHSVAVSGLSAGTTYYYRTVSHGSPEAVSDEKTFNTTSSVTDGGGGASGGGGGGSAAPPVCNDTKPQSVPVLYSAIGGLNSVTLTWVQASGPLSYYLITYGLNAGFQTYGNPNVGGAGTPSYTVGGLSGGVRYYFRVRAGNGCAPGDFSNEISAVVLGGVVSGIAPGFAPGVLGEQTEGKALPLNVEIDDDQGKSIVKWAIAAGFVLFSLFVFLWWKRKKKSN